MDGGGGTPPNTHKIRKYDFSPLHAILRLLVFSNHWSNMPTKLLTEQWRHFSSGFFVLSTGLFQKAIAQSGAPLSFWAMHNKTVNLRQHAGALMNLFGCNQHQMQDKVACMRKVPWQKFMSYDKRKVSTNFERTCTIGEWLKRWNTAGKVYRNQCLFWECCECETSDCLEQVPNISPSEADFKPCVDNHVIHDVPRVLLQQGRIHPVTMMIGTVKDEWTRNIGWFIQELYSEVPHLGKLTFRFFRHTRTVSWSRESK